MYAKQVVWTPSERVDGAADPDVCRDVTWRHCRNWHQCRGSHVPEDALRDLLQQNSHRIRSLAANRMDGTFIDEWDAALRSSDCWGNVLRSSHPDMASLRAEAAKGWTSKPEPPPNPIRNDVDEGLNLPQLQKLKQLPETQTFLCRWFTGLPGNRRSCHIQGCKFLHDPLLIQVVDENKLGKPLKETCRYHPNCRHGKKCQFAHRSRPLCHLYDGSPSSCTSSCPNFHSESLTLQHQIRNVARNRAAYQRNLIEYQDAAMAVICTPRRVVRVPSPTLPEDMASPRISRKPEKNHRKHAAVPDTVDQQRAPSQHAPEDKLVSDKPAQQPLPAEPGRSAGDAPVDPRPRPNADVHQNEEDDAEDGEEMYEVVTDPLCMFCDDGGDLVSCEGPCLRSFCSRPECIEKLGFTEDMLGALRESEVSFLCPNCSVSKLQCFACGAIGGSQQLVRCSEPECGKYYHESCVRKLGAVIREGGRFKCPRHICNVCNKAGTSPATGEIICCRRCPKAYHHLTCLPRHLHHVPNAQRVFIAGIENDGIEQSVLYCDSHAFCDGESTPRQESRLFTASMRNTFLAKLAKNFPHLPSCQAICKELETEKNRAALTNLSAARSHEEDEDTSLAARKRMRLTQAAGDIEKAMAASQLEGSKMHTEPRMDNSDVMHEKATPEWTLEVMSNPHLIQQTRARLESTLLEAEMANPRSAVAEATCKYTPYTSIHPRNTVLSNQQLEHITSLATSSAAGPVSKLARRTSAVSDLKFHFNKLSRALEPWLNAPRYTSYGRHFTRVELLDFAVRMIEPLMLPMDTVVDFSCGANEWALMLKSHIMALHGASIDTLSFDVVTPKYLDGFQKFSWFDVTVGSLPPGENLVVGLNPPFGKGGSFANRWTARSAEHRPRLICLIVPPATPVPSEYEVLYDNRRILGGNAFYVPGTRLDSWNHEPPKFVIMVRRDLVDLVPPDALDALQTIEQDALLEFKRASK